MTTSDNGGVPYLYQDIFQTYNLYSFLKSFLCKIMSDSVFPIVKHILLLMLSLSCCNIYMRNDYIYEE